MISLYAAYTLDKKLPRYQRMRRRRVVLLAALISTIVVLFGYESRIFIALASLLLGVYIWRSLLECMYLSLYRKSNNYWLGFSKTYSLFDTLFAHEALLRLELTSTDIEQAKTLRVSGNTFPEYIESMFIDNPEFRKKLEEKGVTKEVWVGTWVWMEEKERAYTEASFVVSNAAIAHLPSIGVAWSYGKIPYLTRYGSEVYGMKAESGLEHFYERSLHLFENAILKSRGANILLIGSSIEDAREFIQLSAAYIHDGRANKELLHKRIFEIDTEAIIAIQNISEIETIISKVLQEALKAGNIILVIPHAPTFVAAMHTLGYDIALTLSEYMRSPDLHLVLLSDRYGYHTTLETQLGIVQAADKIELDVLSSSILRTIAKKEVISVEYRRHVVFSFATMVVLIEAVERFAPENMHDAICDYIDECALYAKAQGVSLIRAETARIFVAEKSGTKNTIADTTKHNQSQAVASIGEVIQKRVRGQDAAMQSVIRALTRIQSGMDRTNKPLATFLFLGPTGVGKTETAKAIAEAYFGNENKIVRFDMSEFGDATAVPRLIGSFGIGETGLLAGKVRDAEHGVILFDELEKAHAKVQDLMLQILDEGYFTDARGDRVNMKNFIIIATSNAGTDVTQMIKDGVFKAEFLNRFDEIAVYKHLEGTVVRDIAEIKLKKYAMSLYEKKALHMDVTPELITFVADQIESNAFGAREISRVIQNYIESLVARDIVNGQAVSGRTVRFVYDAEKKGLDTIYI